MKKIRKISTCYIISENSIGVECAKIWISKGHKILGLISEDKKNVEWAYKNNIPCYSSTKDCMTIASANEADYLFSIANSEILTDQLLKYPKYAAINFHDGLLTKYAGVHSTSWAILNGETVHGITWHLMTPKIDNGDILVQKEFDILPDETTLSLNLKCYKYAIETFEELVDQIAECALKKYKQDLSKRNYYSLHQKPQDIGVIDWNTTAQEIHTMYRALFFGDYSNRLASLKLSLENEFFIPGKMYITDHQSNIEPGSVVKINDDSIQISTGTADIILSDLYAIDGRPSILIDIISKYNISVGYKLSNLCSTKKTALFEAYKYLSKYEKYWIKQLKNVKPVNLHFSENVASEIDSTEILASSLTITKSYTKNFSPEELVNFILTSFFIYLVRTSGETAISVNLNSRFIVPDSLESIISTKVPFNITVSGDIPIYEIVSQIQRKREEISAKETFALDLLRRTSELHDVDINLPISINIFDSKAQRIIVDSKNLLIFNIYIEDKEIEYILSNSRQGGKKQQELDNLLERLLLVFKQVTCELDLKIQDIDLVSPEELKKLLKESNNTVKDYPKKLITQLFEEQVTNTQESVAVEYKEQKLTYRELNTKSNQLAHYLKSLGIGPGHIVGISLDRSLELIIGMFGTLKSGAAYVPLEPNYPNERLEFILADTKADILLTQNSMKDRFNNYTGKVIILDEDSKEITQQSKQNPEYTINENDLAYIAYTSGSTGVPKGVICHHLGVMNRLYWAWENYPFKKDETCCLQSSIAFVDSTWDIFGTLLVGGRLVLYDQEVSRDIELLVKECFDKKITRITLVPSMLKVLSILVISNPRIFDLIKKLRQIEITGELFDYNPDIKKFIELFQGKITFLDCYGATEATSVIYRDFSDANHHRTHIIANTQIYILDMYMKPVPDGVRGELYIGGVGLAKGYLHRPDLTKERFIQNPFVTDYEAGSLLYKTGDIVIRNPDGNIKFLGREDSQIKIRGHRVELKEIESVLEQYSDISQAIVTFNVSNNSCLAAYIILSNNDSLELDTLLNSSSGTPFALLKGSTVSIITNNIRQYLASKLPDYMIPTFFTYIDQIPLNNNGKRDIKSLPLPMLSLKHLIGDYIAPRNEMEKKLSVIWGNILSISYAQAEIGINDNFFSLGGNSILAIKLTQFIKDELAVGITVSAIFQYNTIKKLANYLLCNNEKITKIEKSRTIENKEQKLSFAQERLWFIGKYEDGSSAYNIPMVFELPRDINLEILKKSIYQTVSRQESLRTMIKEDNLGNSFQYVADPSCQPLEINQITINNTARLNKYLVGDANHIYDLSSEYPIKISIYELFKNDIQTNYLSIVIHHIAFDGWSTDILLNEFKECYAYNLAKSRGLNVSLNLPKLSIQYKDFALWQRNYLDKDRLKSQLDYWNEKLKGFEPLNLLTDFVRPIEVNYSGADVYFELSIKTSDSLRNLAKNLQVSLYSVLLSGYYLMLRIYSNQDDVALGTSVANRHYSQIENLIGCFVNSLVLRIKIKTSSTLKDFIHQVGTEVVEAQLHQDLPFEKLVDELAIEKDTSRHPIFQVMFEMHSFGKDNSDNFLTNYKPEIDTYNVAKFDLSTLIDDSKLQIKGVFNYATSLYSKETIEGYIETYTHILDLFAKIGDSKKTSEVTLQNLTYLNPCRYQQVVHDWNNILADYPSDSTMASLFEEQVQKTPHNIAVVADGRALTYEELNSQANKLANYIKQNYNPKSESLVMIIMDRDIEFLIVMLAVFKVGIAYIPVDPIVPIDRIESIIDESMPILIMANEEYRSLINAIQLVSAELCIFEELKLDGYDNSNLCLDVPPYSLAYVIYTSGSTGRPKGAMIEYKGMLNHLYTKIADMNMTEFDRLAQTASQNFDISVWQFLATLFTGGTTVIFKGTASWDPEQLLEIIVQEKVTIFQTVPSHMYAILPVIENAPKLSKKFDTLRWIIINGEPLSSEICDRWLSLHPNIPIINAYGYTESSDDITHFKIFSKINQTPPKIMPISGTLPNSKIYITDANLTPVPIGAIGEIIAGGIGIGRGYLNRDDLTAQRYVRDVFTNVDHQGIAPTRLYHSGDLGRYLPDGSIEYVGRKDFQVKIRGYRIELEEIESVLCLYEGVKQSVVLTHDHGNNDNTGNKYLVGYYVSDNPLDHESIISYLAGKLPEYMVPSHFVHLTQFPLNINGKLDRKALPKPELTAELAYVAPRNELEENVCKIWAQLLSIDSSKVGINDDFFRLGGDSIVSIQLVSRLRQQLSLSVSVKDIFTYRNIERLYDNVISKSIGSSRGVQVKTEQGLLDGMVPLLPIQQWFFQQGFSQLNHWNQSFLIKVPALDISKLQNAVNNLVNHHDAFKLSYKKESENYVQYYSSDIAPVKLNILDLTTVKSLEECQKIFTEWQSNFDIEQGPICSLGYIKGYEDGSSRLYFAAHHLVIDSVSWRILAEDLQTLYNGGDLGKKGSSYRQWVSAVRNYAVSHEAEREYWGSVLADYIPGSNRLEQMALTNGEVNNHSTIAFSNHITKQLLQEAGAAYNTEINDILLTGLACALFELTGDEVNHITLEGHGREEIDSFIDISRTVGWFTSMYPVCLEAGGDNAVNIKHVKELLRAIPNHGIGYGALVGYGDESLPRISFNYLGQFDSNKAGKEKNWSISSETSGKTIGISNKDQNILNINGLIIDGSLRFTIDSKLSIEDADRFNKLFHSKLTDLIKYTSNQARNYLTVSDVESIISSEYLDKIQRDKDISGVYLANSLQQGFMYHALNQGDIDDAYLVQVIWQYNNVLDVDKLRQAWVYAQEKFASLRLRFAWDEELVQIIDKQGELDWRFIDLSEEVKASAKESKIKEIQQLDRKERYDLSKGNLFRIYLIKEQANSYRCIFSNHHAIIDGWSNPVLMGYVHDTYQALCSSSSINKSIDHSYEYAQKYLQLKQNEHIDYWNNYVAKIEDKGDLSGLLSDRAKEKGLRLSEYNHVKEACKSSLEITGKLYDDLKLLSKNEGVTLNAILQYVWHKVLSIYGGSEQTIVGTIVSGRNIPIDNIEKSVGLYINTLPLIVSHNDDKSKTIIEKVKEIQDNINEINGRSNVNLSKLQHHGQRLFDSLFVFENYPGSINDLAGLNVVFKEGIEKLDYSLGVLAYETKGKLEFTLQYAGELFEAKTISNILALVTRLVEQISSRANKEISSLSYLSESEYKQIVEEWNSNVQDYPQDATIHQLFEEQVRKTPNSIAVSYRNNNLTYDELNNQANQLAHYIKKQYEIKPDDLIALCLDRSHYTLITIMAVLKAGGAYVPIDPSYPDERIKYILQDTKTKLVITNKEYQKRLGKIVNTASVLAIDREATSILLEPESSLAPKTRTTSKSLAYVIYTSGTTGKPKGVLIQHNNVVNYIFNIGSYVKFLPGDKTDYSTSLGFDLTVTTTLCSLCLGGEVIVYEADTKDLVSYTDHLIKNNIDFIKLTPSYFELLIDTLPSTKVRKIILGGEKLNHSILDRLSSLKGSDLVVYDEYGPTEATIGTCNSQIFPGHNITIGRPYSNSKIYVLDKNYILLPIGAVGELYIGGVGVARGYLNQPKLTSDKFLKNSFDESSNLYKTGDLVRYLPDGQLEYIGRNDCQVKLHGYRIELKEVENVLLSYQKIKQCFVTIVQDKYLIAYYVSDNILDEDKIIKSLEHQLPEYMIPKVFVHLTELPMNINGKIDKEKLLTYKLNLEKSFTSPRNDLEIQICALYTNILGLTIDQISIDDNFFKLGGNSILAIKLVSKINSTYLSNLKVVDVFIHATVRSLALKIAQIKNTYQAIVKLNDTYELPNLFMIHPGASGCEVYTSLASQLAGNFSCYGIDSYNLYNKDKITDLSKLASYYLEHIDKVIKNTGQEEYNLLGWSLGGQLSLEIAHILEQRGIKKITLYLLDVILDDDHLLSLRNNLDLEQLKLDYRINSDLQGYDSSYTEKITANMDTESALIKKQTDYLNLKNTNVLLFKAMLYDTTLKISDFRNIYEYSIKLECNNISQIISHKSSFDLVRLNNVSHSTVLQEEELLVFKIIEYYKLQNPVEECS